MCKRNAENEKSVKEMNGTNWDIVKGKLVNKMKKINY